MSSHTSLRQIEPDDRDLVFKGLSDPRVYRFYGVRCLTQTDTDNQMAWYDELQKNKTGQWYVIENKEGIAVGAAGLNNVEKIHKKGEIGFWILPEHQCKGHATQAVGILTDICFNEWKLHRIEAVVETGNISSSRLLESAGFLHEGTLQECEIKEGRFISLEYYALLSKSQSTE